eukprot:SAG31_NODE_7200_length_1758_cov_32.971670_2_plen_70_part_00
MAWTAGYFEMMIAKFSTVVDPPASRRGLSTVDLGYIRIGRDPSRQREQHLRRWAGAPSAQAGRRTAPPY